ncbi:hypothetical protein DMB66_45465 [Actinoplanes sp. ATCC 53533]|nr:hypothetical protein DMB66_45465 [Actinoplanes sp. ATCC 53533]
MTLSSLAHRTSAAPHPLLVVGDRISRRSAAALRDAGIQFVDALGNAFIAFDGALVEVQGRTEPTNQAPKSSPRITQPHQSTNLFSPGRSQVILALLAWPELARGSVREIATAAGMSVGQAHDALTRLEQAGLLLPTSRRLARADELLDYWTAAYPAGLGRRLRLAQYHGDPSRPVSNEQPSYLSGESADGVDIARPSTLTLYLDNPDPSLPILNRWSASPDRIPNIFVRHKFWISPRPHEEDPALKTQNAPWPLVYADLAATGDARLGEVARTWRERCARSEQM